MPRLVENANDRLPVDNPVAQALARMRPVQGEKSYFQLITENNDTPKQARLALAACSGMAVDKVRGYACRCTAAIG